MDEITSVSYADELDKNDPLKSYRPRFIVGNPNLIYMDGNSLGRLPSDTVSYLSRVIEHQWGERLIRSWNEGWYKQSSRLGKKIAQIIGAHPDEVIVCDSTSVNLYKLAYGALKLQERRLDIISDDMNFPSDIYVLQGLIRQFGDRHTLRLVKSSDGISSNMTDLVRMINKQTALVSLSHVVFKSAYMYDMAQITELAHLHGALVIWDLSHSVGVVPIGLKQSKVDMAIGCTYKYLNGGPGSPAFLFVRKDLQEKIENPIWGWFGEKHPFEFKLNYRSGDGIRKFLTGTPPILSNSAIEPSLDLILEAGIKQIRKKCLTQTEYLIELARSWLFDKGFRLGSPEQGERRGAHVSLKHAEAFRICRALLDPEVGGKVIVPDFREPNNIRLGISPLYTRYEDIFQAVFQMKYILENKLYEKYPKSKDPVT